METNVYTFIHKYLVSLEHIVKDPIVHILIQDLHHKATNYMDLRAKNHTRELPILKIRAVMLFLRKKILLNKML